MKRKTLFFSCEPGGAEVLTPVIRLLREQHQWPITVASYGLGLRRFQANHVDCLETTPADASSGALLDKIQPELVITSATSLPQKDMSEKYIWKHAKSRQIKTLAFLDQWQNYALRFSGPTPPERLAYLPDRINCINETGRREMLAEGFHKSLLIPLGQPYLSELKERAARLDAKTVKRQLGLPPDRPILLFVSEAIQENYGAERGYTQYSVLEFFRSAIWPSVQNGYLLVKRHDKDSAQQFAAFIESLKPAAKLIGPEVSPTEALMAADHVYGMTSTMLLEAFILGKKTVSLQPGLKGSDSLILSRQGYIPLIRSENDIDAPFTAKSAADFEFAFRKEDFMQLLSALA